MDIQELLSEMGHRILKARIEREYTQEYLAELVEVSPQSISYVENGKKMIKLENFIKLCLALDMSADYLLFGVKNSSAFSVAEEDFAKLTTRQKENIKNIIDNCVMLCK